MKRYYILLNGIETELNASRNLESRASLFFGLLKSEASICIEKYGNSKIIGDKEIVEGKEEYYSTVIFEGKDGLTKVYSRVSLENEKLD